MRFLNKPLGIILGMSLCIFVGHSEAQIKAQISEAVSKSVVLVQARSCKGDAPSRNGTGFAYGTSTNVVTAYHVVAGCSQIEIWYEYISGQPYRTTRISRALPSKDLALLEVDGPPSDTFLRSAVSFDEDKYFKALGYAVGTPTLGDLDLRISFGNSHLRDMLPLENQQEISGTSIDLDQEVIRFSRPLYPGMSGGPIFDENGQIIAIVAGGLKSGTVSASWGWPASSIELLLQSQAPIDSNSRVSTTTFAFAIETEPADTITCGGLTFEKAQSLSFADAAASSDDVARLTTTANFSGLPLSEIQDFRFQAWVHRESGATVVVPEEADLEADGASCVATSADGIFEQIVQGNPASNQFEINQVSMFFENSVMAPKAVPNIGFYPDSVLSLGSARTRSDGFVVNRKAFFVGKENVAPGRVRAIHQFETLMARGGTFVGIGMINNNVDQCFNNFNQVSLCSFDPDYLRDWAKFVLATQMSTYPVY